MPSIRGARKAGRLAGLHDAVGDRANVNVGASGGDDHEIGEGRFAAQVNRYDVFRLGVFQACQHRLRELVGILLRWPDGRGKRRRRRFVVGRECQRWYPPAGSRAAGRLSDEHDPSSAGFQLAGDRRRPRKPENRLQRRTGSARPQSRWSATRRIAVEDRLRARPVQEYATPAAAGRQSRAASLSATRNGASAAPAWLLSARSVDPGRSTTAIGDQPRRCRASAATDETGADCRRP